MSADIEKERAAFELWLSQSVYPVAGTRVCKRRPNGEYIGAHIEMMWQGWQARAEVKS